MENVFWYRNGVGISGALFWQTWALGMGITNRLGLALGFTLVEQYPDEQHELMN